MCLVHKCAVFYVLEAVTCEFRNCGICAYLNLYICLTILIEKKQHAILSEQFLFLELWKKLEKKMLNLYIDILLKRLEAKGIGCYMGNIFMGCLGYADDIVLLAPSITALQTMLNICSDYGDDYGVSYNTQKTVCLEISKNKIPDYCAVHLGKNELAWVESVKYLGIHITNNLCDSKDIKIKRGNFFASVNSLIGNLKDLSSCVINDLFSSYCCSFYGSQCWSFRNKDIQCIYTAFNRQDKTRQDL